MQLDFSISAARLRSLRSGAVLVRDTPAVLQIEGGGALTCLQGLLTQDLAAPGDGTLSYGAMLTPKGMIVADLWALRDGERFLLVFESGARETVRALLGRMLPPRLAKVTDLSETWRAGWLLGCAAPERLARAIGSSAPAPGKVARPDEGPLLVASGPPNATWL